MANWKDLLKTANIAQSLQRARTGLEETTTYVLGQGAKIYLRQGCQWGPRGIKTVIQQILAEAKADSVIDRLRDDLKKRLKT